MKRNLFLMISLLMLISAAAAVDKDTVALDFVKALVSKASAENGYINALRFFQYTSTAEKNNPYSYVLSKYGKDAVGESGLTPADKGKFIPALSNRSGKRIDKLWKENSEELFKLFSLEAYNGLLKSEVDSLIEFHNAPDYEKMIKKMKAKSGKPGVKTLDTAGKISQWSGYRQLAFWYRRSFEKNDKVVFEILKELKAHYEQ